MSRVRRRSVALACLAAAFALVAWGARESPTASRPRSVTERLLGPIAGIAAALEWTRFDDALRAGRPDLAYARAEFALALAPGEPAGWAYLAHHLAYERAAPAIEPDRAARERWVHAALAVLDRGETVARHAGELAFQRGVLFLALALMDDAERSWAGTRREAWQAAARAFDRAAMLGEPAAAEAAEAARAESDGAPGGAHGPR